MPPKLSEVELLLNKAALHQARLREALGIKHDEVDDAEARKQEDEMFKCEPEFAGLGYKAKDDPAAELKRKAAISEDKLRRHLLGKSTKATNSKHTTTPTGQKVSADRQEDSDDDEDARGRAFVSKKRKVMASVPQTSLENDNSNDDVQLKKSAADTIAKECFVTSADTVAPKRAAASYLDEVLAQKAKKRKKKNKKSKGGVESA